MTDLIDEATIRKFLEALHTRAAGALDGVDPPGVLNLCNQLPDDRMYTQPFELGDVDGMVEAAIRNTKAGRNVYIESRTVRPGHPDDRGKIGATVGVFAFVIDRDADTGKAGHPLSGYPSVAVETSPHNYHQWLFLDRALNAAAAKTIGDTLRKASGADDCTGVVTQPYRVPGTPNFPDAKKRSRGRTTVATRLLNVSGRVWTVDDLSAAFPQSTNTKLHSAKAQPSEKPAGALNGDGPTRGTPKNSTVVKLKVARQSTPKMDRSQAIPSCVAAAMRAGVTPDDLETLMRQHPDGCAGKYLENGDRLRARDRPQLREGQDTR